MAVILHSKTDLTFTANSASKVITKPTGLAVGDLMVAQLVASEDNPPSYPVISAPVGWTRREFQQTTSAAPRKQSMYIFSKIADASDVAASAFTFTCDLTADQFGGGMVRINGHHPVSYWDTSRADILTSAGTTFVSLNALTPTYTGELYLMFANTEGNVTLSSYLISNNNPIWTEAYDVGTATIASSLAYATGTTVSGSGDWQFQTSSSTDNKIGILAYIKPAISTTISADLLSLGSSVLAATIAYGTTFHAGILSFASSVLSPNVSCVPSLTPLAKSATATLSTLSKNSSSMTPLTKTSYYLWSANVQPWLLALPWQYDGNPQFIPLDKSC